MSSKQKPIAARKKNPTSGSREPLQIDLRIPDLETARKAVEDHEATRKPRPLPQDPPKAWEEYSRWVSDHEALKTALRMAESKTQWVTVYQAEGEPTIKAKPAGLPRQSPRLKTIQEHADAFYECLAKLLKTDPDSPAFKLARDKCHHHKHRLKLRGCDVSGMEVYTKDQVREAQRVQR